MSYELIFMWPTCEYSDNDYHHNSIKPEARIKGKSQRHKKDSKKKPAKSLKEKKRSKKNEKSRKE
jgi:hypothetical protein